MAVSVLTYTREATINDGGDLLAKLDSFATALGWATELQTNVAWTHQGGGIYAWDAGSDEFLEIKSTGYGSQNLVYRFWWDMTAAGTRGDLYYSLIDPNNPTYSTSSATNPYLQNRVNTTTAFSRMSLPDGVFADGAYLFGNGRFIAVICGLYSTAVAGFMMGLPDLLPELYSEADISFFWPGQSYLIQAANWYWDSLLSFPDMWAGPFGYMDQSTVFHRYQATVGSGPSGGVATNVFQKGANIPEGDFATLKYLTRYNAFSDKRIGAQPTIFLKDSGTSQWFPCGVMPMLLIPYSGLTIGGTLTYGSDTYRCFPNTLQAYNYGIAFRTA